MTQKIRHDPLDDDFLLLDAEQQHPVCITSSVLRLATLLRLAASNSPTRHRMLFAVEETSDYSILWLIKAANFE